MHVCKYDINSNECEYHIYFNAEESSLSLYKCKNTDDISSVFAITAWI